MLAYNQERYIDEAIHSIMAQVTDYSFELVIGNDASTDSTGEKCEEWRKRYPDNIVLINREKNIGLQQNFIQSYSLCRGEYVAICEGDDFWCNKHKLQRQAEFLDNNPDYSCCFHRVINYYEDRGTKSLSNGGQRVITDIMDLARSNYISNVSSMFRRRLFGELPEWFAQVSTYDYAIHLLNAQYGKIYYMKSPMAVYRQHGKAIWSEAGIDKKLDIALVIRELLMDYFKEKRTDVYEALRNAHSQICLSLMLHYSQIQDTIKKEATRKRLLDYNPHWSDDDIQHQLEAFEQNRCKHRQFSKRVLTWCREKVSLFIPLPHIKD